MAVGISDYYTQNDLLYADDDAIQFKNALTQYKQWSSSNINLITNSNATESAIKNAVSNMPQTAGNTDLFFFSGHGDFIGVIPYAYTYYVYVNPQELNNCFTSSYSQFACIIDACQSGCFSSYFDKGFVGSACGVGSENGDAYENTSVQHGAFSYGIIQGIVQSSLNTIEDVYDYAYDVVLSLEDDQEPTYCDYFHGEISIYNSSYSTSGSLSHAETWDNTNSLTGNVSIPSGTSLTLTDNVALTSNGYSIASTGGNIYCHDGCDVVSIKDNNSIVGIYSSLLSAVNAASSGQVIEILGDYTLECNITIPSGRSVYIDEDANLVLNSYVISGDVTIDDKASITPDIRLIASSNVVGLYPDLNSAFSAGTNVELHSDLTFTSNYTVTSGNTLSILDDTEIEFASGKYLYVNGTLNTNDVNFMNFSGTWGGGLSFKVVVAED